MQCEWSKTHNRDTNGGSRLDTNGFMSWECTEMQADKAVYVWKTSQAGRGGEKTVSTVAKHYLCVIFYTYKATVATRYKKLNKIKKYSNKN